MHKLGATGPLALTSMSNPAAQTLYIPIASPPTPAPSPGPTFSHDSPHIRRQFLTNILASCTSEELLFISAAITPRLKRDFLVSLPPELALYILSFVDDPRTLGRAAQVSRRWRALVREEGVWKNMCELYGYEQDPSSRTRHRSLFRDLFTTSTNWRKGGHLLRSHCIPVPNPESGIVTSLALDPDWIVIGLANAKIQVYSATTGVLARTLSGHDLGVWSVALVSKGGWRAPDPGRKRPSLHSRLAHLGLDNAAPPVGALNSEADTLPASLRIALGLDLLDESSDSEDDYAGVVDEDALDEFARLIGSHPSNTRPSQAKSNYSDMCYSSQGWGQPNSIIVSGGCDKALMIWDAMTGREIYRLFGHSSTIRCIRVLQNRPIAVSGSRDSTLRVWDIQKGRCLRVLEGHQGSVRCLDAFGNRVVSGSYDTTCRIWDVDTGECLHVLQGHFHQIYAVALDGKYVASGGLDTTVRLWDAQTGTCVALLQGHTALVCQLQLSPSVLITGGSDGRVITFSLDTMTIQDRIAAHDCSITSLQFVDIAGGDASCHSSRKEDTLLITGGNDGRVRLYEVETGQYVREVSEGGETVWRVVAGWGVCVVVCKRGGKTVVEIWSMRPRPVITAPA